MNTDKYTFQKTFQHTGEAFSADMAAEKWLKEKGFSLGTMQSPEPRAIVKGEHYLPKWKHFSYEMREQLDGVATATDWRNGDVTVYLLSEPE